MKVEFSHQFIKLYKKRFSHNQNFQRRFEERLKLFVQNPQENTLKDHALLGRMKDHRAFSVTGDIRVVYYMFGDVAYFVDIGTHNQVYGD